MTAVKANLDVAGARLIKAKHREIAIRYRQGKKPFSIATIRVAELCHFFQDSYGQILPDDDAGRADARIMAHHLAMISGDQRQRITAWLYTWVPWMTAEERDGLIESVLAKPIRWRADKLAALIGLSEATRTRLGITTIGCNDMTKAERAAARKARKRVAMRQQRKAAGAMLRAEYLIQSKERGKPWIAEGISRRTWFRRQARAQ